MRTSDRDRLSQPQEYPNAEAAERDLEERLGVCVPGLWEIRREMLNDLDPEKYGIGWWAPNPDDKRRILISDHLVQALQSISQNLVEASLHHLEFLDCSEQHAREIARPGWPKQHCANDLLAGKTSALHVCGFFRALGSALDCLAAAAVGVFAVPQSILRADFGGLREWLGGKRDARRARLPSHQFFAKCLEEAVEGAGPEGWLAWVLGYRNMLVHRGRRTEMNLLRAEWSVFDARGNPVGRYR